MTDALKICEAFGIAPKALPTISGTCSGPALIVGSGRCIWNDIDPAEVRCPVMAVNDIGMHWPGPLAHWYSNDARMLRLWWAARRPELVNGQTIIRHSCNRGSDHIWWPWPGHGSSGLGAVYTALALGYGPLVLAGMPLDGSGHYFDPPNRSGPSYETEMRYWRNAKEKGLLENVRSLSGNTRELLGGPD